MAAGQPLTASPQLNMVELGVWVRNWVHYDNLANSLYRQCTNARKVRDEFENRIRNALLQANMDNAVIQITGGKLVLAEEKHAQALTLNRLEEILHAYYQAKGATAAQDETLPIMRFLKKQRGYEVTRRLKKQMGPLPVPPAPLPPASVPPPHNTT